MRLSRPQWLLLACVMLLAAHVAGGHAHADVLAAIQLHDHVPGDDHHESAGGSCDGVKASADSAPAPSVAGFVLSRVMSPECDAVPGETGSVPDRPPLFLLHASLLI